MNIIEILNENLLYRSKISRTEVYELYRQLSGKDNPSQEELDSFYNMYSGCCGQTAIMSDVYEQTHTEPSHEYVDLGLPSGTLWATCNIGADNPEDAGLYFQWGDTQGYTAAQVGTDKVFDWAHYKYSNDDGSEMTRYNATDELTELLPEDDAATANWGSDWRMPTADEVQELIDNTIHEFVTDAEENPIGMRFTGNGNSIFVPSAGFAYGTSVDGIGDIGGCWSGLLDSEYVGNAQELYFNWMEGDVYVYNYNRYYGFSVRPVRVQNQ
jgi:hypothetical protein